MFSEVSKWILPILCRGHGKSLSDFPVSLVRTKVDLATNYMAVLDIVERGISRSRAKTLYELVDSQFYLTYLDFREGILEKDIIKRRSLGMQIEKHILLK